MAANPTQREKQALLTPAELIRARVDQALRAGEAAMEVEDGQVPALATHPTKVSPWLELTRWPEYLWGQDLTTAALLGCPPDQDTEPLLVQFSASVQRLVSQAYHAIQSGQINKFDQIQINTFHREPGLWNQPIQIHLRPKTYRQYYQVWQRLVCFTHQSSQPNQPIWLRHQLNTAQLAALDRMEEYSHGLLALAGEEAKAAALGRALATITPPGRAPRTVPWKKTQQQQGTSQAAAPAPAARTLAPRPPPPGPAPAAEAALPPLTGPVPEPPRGPREAKLQAQLDQATLDLSIALLDHPLKGDLFNSTLVGFLAVLGVDAARQTFQDPYSYTSYLSGLVKMAQMLVALRAVREAKAGQVSHPADALDEMRERFLVYGVRAPFGWIARLRTYGKKIQNSTTSLGYIY
jgi:hypothetical protein